MKKVLKFYLLLVLLLAINLVFFISPDRTKAASASFYLSPASKQINVGDTVSASVMISADSAINAGEGSVSFSSDILEYQSVSTAGSIFTFWTSGPSGSASGVSFGGGLANPGYSGGGGTVLTITWKAKAEGTAAINVSGSRILANDGSGTNILSGSSGGTITVGEAKSSQKVSVKSTSHPDQNAWYNQKKVELSWSAKSASGYAFDFNQTANSDPQDATTSATSKSYDASADGVWYFHVKGQFDSGWGPITHFKIQVDTVAPEAFTVTINQEGGTKNPTPIVTFEAKDATSGIGRYEGVVDNGTPFAVNSGDKLPKQKPGDRKVIIRAIDKAGNTRESQGNYHIEGIAPPEILDLTKVVGLLDAIRILGRSAADDTIIIYLNDEEVARFKAGDYLVSDKNPSFFGLKIFAESSDKIVWQYTLIKPLPPGDYFLRFGRIDKNGAESELTEPFKVKIVSSVIRIGKYAVPTIYVLILLLIVIVALVVVIVLLLKKLRKLAKSGKGPIGLAYNRLRQLFAKTEKEIDQEIDKTIPEYDLSKRTIKEMKKDLKRKIHQDIQKEETEVGALEPKQAEQPEEPKQSEQPEKRG